MPAPRGLSGKLLFKALFPRKKAKLWDPNRDPCPSSLGIRPESKRLFCNSPTGLSSTRRQTPILPGGKTAHGHPPDSTCYSKNHSIERQLTELQRPWLLQWCGCRALLKKQESLRRRLSPWRLQTVGAETGVQVGKRHAKEGNPT